MSRNSAAMFLMHVRNDEGLQSELEANPAPESFVEKARSRGMNFTDAELRGVVAAEQFYQTASEDAPLSKRVREAGSEDELLAIARELGFECGIEDLEAVLNSPRNFIAANDGELSDAELEKVAGGMFPGSSRYGYVAGFPDVCKVPAPPAPFVPVPYPSSGADSSISASKSVKVQPITKG